MSNNVASQLFQPLKVGKLTLGNRLVMAPLTRYRADKPHVPHPFVATYYAQRASVPGTLLITEATLISNRAGGYANVPGIWSAEQIKGWRAVTDAVHAQGSYIFCQLWALGRVSDAKVLQEELGPDAAVVGASAIPVDDKHTTPTPLSDADIHGYIADYAQAARNAIEAGFDGIEIHGANGYLGDQFLQDVTNQRDDAWGGSVEKRSRFLHEVAKACAAAIGADRVGIRLSPFSEFQGMRMKDPQPQYVDVLAKLRTIDEGRGLAYVHFVQQRDIGSTDRTAHENLDWAVEAWQDGAAHPRPFLVAGGFNKDNVFAEIDGSWKGRDVAVVMGRWFIANPDLPFRLREGLPLNQYDRSTFYLPESEKGYTDYPFSKEWEERGKAEAEKERAKYQVRL